MIKLKLRSYKMIKPIRNEQDYELALSRVESLMDAKPNSDEFDEVLGSGDENELFSNLSNSRSSNI